MIHEISLGAYKQVDNNCVGSLIEILNIEFIGNIPYKSSSLKIRKDGTNEEILVHVYDGILTDNDNHQWIKC